MIHLRRSAQLIAMFFVLGLSACAPAASSTAAPFVPPAAQPLPSSTPAPAPTVLLQASPALAALTGTPTAPGIPTALPAAACTNALTFVQDLTIPDGSAIPPGAAIDKQWLVANSGTCSWDATYRFNLVGGEALGAASEQALYPARAGKQAVLRITFVAPLEAGTYQSAWQAFAPDGTAFGDPVYMTINVSP
jgi:hypothetical protein